MGNGCPLPYIVAGSVLTLKDAELLPLNPMVFVQVSHLGGLVARPVMALTNLKSGTGKDGDSMGFYGFLQCNSHFFLFG